jgi:type II secretory pathway pseudopilin PulG
MSPRSKSPGPRGVSKFEAAVAIAIVGVLLAVLLHRLASTQAAFRQVRLKTLMATTQATANLFRLRCEARASAPAGGTPDCRELLIEGRKVVGVHGWPAASADGIAAAVNSWGPTADIDWRPDWIDGQPALRVSLKPIEVAGTCEFIYAQAPSPGAGPRIELIDASCP